MASRPVVCPVFVRQKSSYLCRRGEAAERCGECPLPQGVPSVAQLLPVSPVPSQFANKRSVCKLKRRKNGAARSFAKSRRLTAKVSIAQLLPVPRLSSVCKQAKRLQTEEEEERSGAIFRQEPKTGGGSEHSVASSRIPRLSSVCKQAKRLQTEEEEERDGAIFRQEPKAGGESEHSAASSDDVARWSSG